MVIDLESLTVEEWLRALREHPLPNLPNAFYCRSCAKVHMYAFSEKRRITHCFARGTPVTRLGQRFWRKVSEFIRQGLISDPWLLARVKAELPNQDFPQLMRPLDWLKPAWDRVRNPRGRPSDLPLRFFIYRWVTHLSAPRMSLVIDNNGVTKESILPPIMSRTRALHLLATSDQLNSPLAKPNIRKIAGIRKTPVKDVCSLKEAFEKEAIETFKKIPCLDLRELKRAVKWVKDFHANPSLRIGGLKPRRRRSTQPQK